MPLTTEGERTGASVTGAATATQVRPGQAGAGVLRNREFRGVILAQATSECGDQIAAIAISLLVYGRSNSPFLAAATYAVTYLPWVFGSIVLSPLADRFSRRNVMLTCDAGRAVVIGLLALASMVHGMPIGALIALVLVSSFFSPPFSSARGATLPDIFESGKRYVRAVAISRILQQVDQVFGFVEIGARRDPGLNQIAAQRRIERRCVIGFLKQIGHGSSQRSRSFILSRI